MFVCRGFGPSYTSCRDMGQCLLVFVRVSQQSYNIKINKHNSVKNLRKQHGSLFQSFIWIIFYISIINLDCSSDKVSSLEGLSDGNCVVGSPRASEVTVHTGVGDWQSTTLLSAHVGDD